MRWHLAAIELYQFSVVTSLENSKTSSSCLEDTESVSISLLKRPKKARRNLQTWNLWSVLAHIFLLCSLSKDSKEPGNYSGVGGRAVNYVTVSW